MFFGSKSGPDLPVFLSKKSSYITLAGGRLAINIMKHRFHIDSVSAEPLSHPENENYLHGDCVRPASGEIPLV